MAIAGPTIPDVPDFWTAFLVATVTSLFIWAAIFTLI